MIRSFILGNPRSGTSLLRIMLNAHPQIAAPPECGFLQWWYAKYGDWSEHDGHDDRHILAFAHDVFQSKKMETWELPESMIIEALESERPSSYGQACAVIYHVWYQCQQKDSNTTSMRHSLQAIVDKNNYYINHLNQIDEVWPEARYIFLTRDGRDVAASYKDLQGTETDSPYAPDLPTSIPEIAAEWSTNNKRAMNFLKRKPETRWIHLRYEDLVRSPEESLHGPLSLLEVSYRECVTAYYKYNDEPDVTLDWKERTLQPPDPSRIGRYQKALTSCEVQQFEQEAAPLLHHFGY